MLGALVGPHLLPSTDVIRLKNWPLLEVMDCSVFTLLLSGHIQKTNGNFSEGSFSEEE